MGAVLRQYGLRNSFHQSLSLELSYIGLLEMEQYYSSIIASIVPVQYQYLVDTWKNFRQYELVIDSILKCVRIVPVLRPHLHASTGNSAWVH